MGSVIKLPEGTPIGYAIFMDKLDSIPESYSDEAAIFATIREVSRIGFHNDFKLDNLLLDSTSRVRAIDFDYFDETTLIVSVSSFQSIEVDLRDFLKSLSDTQVGDLRAFYDYTYLSASMAGTHSLYPRVIARLAELFRQLQVSSILHQLIKFIGEDKISDIPFEVLVRCPDIDGVSFSIFDLRGNAFAHRVPEWEGYPSLIRSTGVYWPDR